MKNRLLQQGCRRQVPLNQAGHAEAKIVKAALTDNWSDLPHASVHDCSSPYRWFVRPDGLFMSTRYGRSGELHVNFSSHLYNIIIDYFLVDHGDDLQVSRA
jgi:hypothetical protein